VRERILSRNDPFAPPGLRYVSQIEESKALQRSAEPCIVIAGSGMCEGGRIVHHFTQALGNPDNCVLIVGFMAQHTLGRRLVERRRDVKVLGLDRELRARVLSLQGLSAHADRDDLVRFVCRISARGHLKQVALVHGEDEAKQMLHDALCEAGVRRVIVSERGKVLEL